MKKTKKFVSFLAILLIAILTLSCCIFFACGSDDEEPETTVPGTTDDGTSGGTNEEETDSNVTAVYLTPDTLTIAEGESEEITATVTLSDDADADYEVAYAWASDNEAVAKVSGTGATITVTAGESGTTNITVTADGKSATCVVTVTYRTMTDSDAAALYTAIKTTCEYEGSYTAYGTWTYYDNEESYDSEDEELEISSSDDTDLYTFSYDSETGYTVYKDDWKYVEMDESGEQESWRTNYMYFVPDPEDEDGDTFILYEYSGNSYDGIENKIKSSADKEDRDEYSNIADATFLDDFLGGADFSCTSLEDLLECLCFLDDEDDYDAVAQVGTSGTNTIYTISVTICESDMDEDETEEGGTVEYGSEYTYTCDFEFCVNKDGLIYAYTSTETDTENTVDAEGGYYNYTGVDYMVWEITYSFDESLMLSEDEMAEYEEEN